MRRRAALFAILAGLVLVVTQSTTGFAATKGGDAPVQFVRADLAGGSREGIARGAPLTLSSKGLTLGTYTDSFGYGDINYQSGSWTSSWIALPFAFDELVASWNATTPATTWIRVEMQARGSGRETTWYTMQVWASGDGDIHRTAVRGQGTTDGFIAIDTFIRDKKAALLDSYRLKITLYRKVGSSATPSVRFLGAMTSAAFSYDTPSAFTGGFVDLKVPTLSQEVHTDHFPDYDRGGETWCSPTSTAMVLGFWKSGPTAAQLAVFPGPTADGSPHEDGQVDYAARYVYDWSYAGTGNWPNNTAYAATFGLNGFVTRLRSLSEAQLFIKAGIPLVASINGRLPGFLFGKTSGHLLVIRGFTAAGDVITNDPAVYTNAEAKKTYEREDFEDVWLGGSAGIVYVIYPSGTALPAHVPGLPWNW
jgi:peptidase C39-like protein